MAIKLIVTLDADMDREDAAAVANELENHDGVFEVTDMYGRFLDGEDGDED